MRVVNLNVLIKFWNLAVFAALFTLISCHSKDADQHAPQSPVFQPHPNPSPTTRSRVRPSRPASRPLPSYSRVPTPVLSPSPSSLPGGRYTHPVIQFLHDAEPELLMGFPSLNITHRYLLSGVRHNQLDRVIIDSRIDPDHVILIAKDLRHLENLGLDYLAPEAEDLRRILGLPSINGPALKQWFEENVQIILAHNLWRYAYQNFLGYNFLEDIFKKSPGVIPPHRPGLVDFSTATGFTVGPPDGVNPVRSVIKLYPSLMNEGSAVYPTINYSRSLMRIAVMLHEAVHSLGNHADNSFSMLHAICPVGSADSGARYCDEFTNGPYTVQAKFLRWSIRSCQSCSNYGKDAMRVMMAIAEGRAQALGAGRREANINPELDP